MTRSLALLTCIAVLLSAACFGGGGNSSEPGAADPQGAVRNLIRGIAEDDQVAIERAINPIYAQSLGEVGVSDLVQLKDSAPEMSIRNLNLRAEYDSERENARVLVSGTIVTDDGEAQLTDRVLLTSMQGERWFVTSPNSEYWASQLRPPPSAWAQVQVDANPALPGAFVPPHPGADGKLNEGSDDRAHFANDLAMPICSAEQLAANNVSNPLCYPSNPPTSGPHAASAAPFRVFTSPVGKEFLVHSMEHGGVVIWYNTGNTQVVQQLTALTESNIQRGKQVVLTPYPGMEADTVAVTAWTRLDKFPVGQFSIDRLQAFINTHERRFNPEGF
jgi:hypothetical protein